MDIKSLNSPVTRPVTSSETILIRAANNDDLPLIAIMTWEILVVTGRTDGYQFEKMLQGVRHMFAKSDQCRYLVALSGTRMVGQLKLTKQFNDLYCAEEGFVEHVFIHPEFRGQRIYDRMHQRALQMCGEWNLRRMALHVVGTNTQAKRAYEKQGMWATGFWMTQET
tara:strand:+ start:5925 stop:6425 length:501 start_codon:yes stop_codon:yes gene_type:complete